jgi:hypothetical protein
MLRDDVYVFRDALNYIIQMFFTNMRVSSRIILWVAICIKRETVSDGKRFKI